MRRGEGQHIIDLLRSQRLRRPARSARGHLRDLDHVAAHQVPGHRAPDRPIEARMHSVQRLGAQVGSQLGESGLRLAGREGSQLAGTERRKGVLASQEPVLLDRRRLLPAQPECQPVLDHLNRPGSGGQRRARPRPQRPDNLQLAPPGPDRPWSATGPEHPRERRTGGGEEADCRARDRAGHQSPRDRAAEGADQPKAGTRSSR